MMSDQEAEDLGWDTGAVPPNPPAFPNLAPNSCGPHIDKRDGMTLRDWLAGQALPAVLRDEAHPQEVARLCYLYADALLAKRPKPQGDAN